MSAWIEVGLSSVSQENEKWAGWGDLRRICTRLFVDAEQIFFLFIFVN